MVHTTALILLFLANAVSGFRPPLTLGRHNIRLRSSGDDNDDVEAFRRKLQKQNDLEVEKFREKLTAGALEFDRVTQAQVAPADDEWVKPTADPRALQ